MRKHRKKYGKSRAWLFASIAAAVLGGLWTAAPACDVPVFRYALERWTPEFFNVFVFHRGKLAAENKAVTDWLGKRADDANRPCNELVHVIDVDTIESADANDPNSTVPASLRSLWETQKDKPLPRMVACFPSPPGKLFVAWSGPVSARAARTLVDSPARRKVVEGICKGDSAVWVLLECGDKAKDDAAADMLNKHLARLSKQMMLPGADPTNPDDTAEFDNAGLALRIGFSTVRVRRDDPAEAAFIDMLLATEPDLREVTRDEPAAFAVFGQGRALYALVGAGINQENIEEFSAFICGACSCQVKAQNPGTDLLIAADWYAPFRNAPVVTAPLPDVIGAPAIDLASATTTQPAEAAAVGAGAGNVGNVAAATWSPIWTIPISIGLIVVVGVVLALVVSRRQGGKAT